MRFAYLQAEKGTHTIYEVTDVSFSNTLEDQLRLPSYMVRSSAYVLKLLSEGLNIVSKDRGIFNYMYQRGLCFRWVPWWSTLPRKAQKQTFKSLGILIMKNKGWKIV